LSVAAAASLKAAGDSWPIYRRLLKYARPHLGVFLIGVLGAGLFAVSNASLAYLVQKFLRGAFLVKDPAVLWEVPIGVVVLFGLLCMLFLCGVRMLARAIYERPLPVRA